MANKMTSSLIYVGAPVIFHSKIGLTMLHAPLNTVVLTHVVGEMNGSTLAFGVAGDALDPTKLGKVLEKHFAVVELRRHLVAQQCGQYADLLGRRSHLQEDQ